MAKSFLWKTLPGDEMFFKPDAFKIKHEELGFIEPIKYYDPSIGISELIYLDENTFCISDCLLVTSLRANSIYALDISRDFKKLSSKGRIFLEGHRIRDVDYDKDLNLLILLAENVPALITIKRIV